MNRLSKSVDPSDFWSFISQKLEYVMQTDNIFQKEQTRKIIIVQNLTSFVIHWYINVRWNIWPDIIQYQDTKCEWSCWCFLNNLVWLFIFVFYLNQKYFVNLTCIKAGLSNLKPTSPSCAIIYYRCHCERVYVGSVWCFMGAQIRRKLYRRK